MGKTCTVHKCIDNETKTALAMKKYKNLGDLDINMEINAMEDFDHENLLKIVGKDEKHNKYIVLELMENGELFDYVFEAGKKFPKELARYYAK
mmetsp:Transcript_6987/g.942  ORF Transcript_6987/g.942 Transcript_6987/m.942 type:complete len:93 (-) Transcript_6987:651-929(-)